MKNFWHRMVLVLVAALAWGTPAVMIARAEPPDTAFMFQGAQKVSQRPFTGLADYRFRVFDAPTGGNLVANALVSGVPVNEGLFSAEVDFGTGFIPYLERSALWLQIDVQGTPLSPRQSLAAAPRALHALVATTAREAASSFRITGPTGSLRFDTGRIRVDPAVPGIIFDHRHVFVGDANEGKVHFGMGAGHPSLGTDPARAGLHMGPGDIYLFSDVNDRAALHLGTGLTDPCIALDPRAGPGLLLGGSAVYLGGPDTVTPKLHLGGVSDPDIRLDRAAGSVVIDSARVTVGNPEIAESLIFAGGPALLSSLTERGVIAITSPSPQIAEGLRFGAAGPGLRHDPGTGGIIVVDGREVTIGDANESGPKALRFGSDPRSPLPFISTSALNAQVLSITAPHSLRLEGGFVAVGLASTQAPAFRLDLPNTAGPAGQGRANAWTTYSSRRWKENIRPIADALGKIARLEGVTFDWKLDHGGGHDIGFVAEDVAAVLPELVEWDDDAAAALSLKYDRMSALAIQGIKEQQALIESLLAENDDLRARLERLEAAPGAAPDR